MWHEIWHQLGISWAGVIAVALASLTLYVIFTAIMHRIGPRLNASGRTTSFAVLTVLGAISARAMLGNSPTLFGALVALTTVLLAEAIAGRGAELLERHGRINGSARVVMVNGEPILSALAQSHLTADRLMTRLRQAGMRSASEAHLVIVEPRGSLTVLRSGETIGRSLLAGIDNSDVIPNRYVRDDESAE